MKKSLSLMTLCLLQSFQLALHANPANMQDLLQIKKEVDQSASAITELKSQLEEKRSEKQAQQEQLKQLASEQSERIAQLTNALSAQEEAQLLEVAYEEHEEFLEAAPAEVVAAAPLSPALDSDSVTPELCIEELPAESQTYFLCPYESAFWVTGEFLYWRTLINETEYAVTGQPLAASPTALCPIGDYQSSRYNWDPGLRVALGYRFDSNLWELEAQYTYLHNTGHDQVKGPSTLQNGMLIPTFYLTFEDDSETAVREASSHLELHYNLFNLAIAQTHIVCDHIAFRPYLAVSGAWIKQDWDILYISSDFNETVDIDWKYNAGGMRFGLSTDWRMGLGFSLLSQLSLGGYVGSYHNDQQIVQNNKDPVSSVTLENSHLQDARFAFNLQLLLGPALSFSRDTWGLTLYAAYEINPWFNLHSYNETTFNTGANSRNTQVFQGILTPQGLTAGAKLTF